MYPWDDGVLQSLCGRKKGLQNGSTMSFEKEDLRVSVLRFISGKRTGHRDEDVGRGIISSDRDH